MLSQIKVLVVEDEADIADLIRFNLSLEGAVVVHCGSCEEAREVLAQQDFDICLLDVMLPGISGLEFCREIKKNKNFPFMGVVMLTAKIQDDDLVLGLEVGADDYIGKPFSPKVLVARIRSVLRRLNKHIEVKDKEFEDRIVLGEVEVFPSRFQVLVSGSEVKLTHSEFMILEFLASKPGWVFSRTQIVDAIRGEDYAVTERAIDFQMVGLRKKLGIAGAYIETVRGVGYRMKEFK